MRVLMLHNRYKIKGGEDESTRAELALLRRHGHDAELLEIDNDAIPPSGNVRTALAAVWSRGAHQFVRDELARRRYDILHVQNFFPLWSPAVYYSAAARGAAVVQSVRNYRLVCPSASLFRAGKHCESCVGKKTPWPGVVHGCYHESRLASGAVAAMLTTHWALGTWDTAVHQYVALTKYVRDRLVAGKFPAARIAVKPNFVRDIGAPRAAAGPGEYFIYVGRMTPEKGLGVLLDAWRLTGGTERLKLVGGGELPPGLTLPAGVEVAGARPSDETYALIAGAKALILPAMWAEPFGRVVIEAFALGTPVIASSTGGLPELVEHERTGLLFEPGNIHQLARAIARVSNDTGLAAGLRERARAAYETSFSESANHDRLIAIYERALAVAAGGKGSRS